MRDRLALAERLVAGDFLDLPVIDGHFHLMSEVIRADFVANLREIMRACRVGAIAIASLAAARGNPVENLMAALAKVAYPKQAYAFGGVCHRLPAVPEERIDPKNLQRYAGASPKPLDTSLAVEEYERILALARRYAIVHRVLPEVRRFIGAVQSRELLRDHAC